MDVDEMMDFVHGRPMKEGASEEAKEFARKLGYVEGGTAYGPFTTEEVIELMLAGISWPKSWFRRRKIMKAMKGMGNEKMGCGASMKPKLRTKLKTWGVEHMGRRIKSLCFVDEEHGGPFVCLRDILGIRYYLCLTCFYTLLDEERALNEYMETDEGKRAIAEIEEEERNGPTD